jgi:signal transduction histidine kinase
VAQDGRSILVEGTLIGRHVDGNLVALHGFFRDITERVRLQEQLIERERLAALGRITGAIAHELGTPSIPVLGYTQLWPTPTSPRMLGDDQKIIESQVQRMAEIIKYYLSRTRGLPTRIGLSTSMSWSWKRWSNWRSAFSRATCM